MFSFQPISFKYPLNHAETSSTLLSGFQPTSFKYPFKPIY